MFGKDDSHILRNHLLIHLPMMHKEESSDPFIENNTDIYSNLLPLKQAQKYFNATAKSLNYWKEYDIVENITSIPIWHMQVTYERLCYLWLYE